MLFDDWASPNDEAREEQKRYAHHAPMKQTPSLPTMSGAGKRKRGNRYTLAKRLTPKQLRARARAKRAKKARRLQRKILRIYA